MFHPIRHAREAERARIIRWLRDYANNHHGKVGDQRRRAAVNHAATLLEQGKEARRP